MDPDTIIASLAAIEGWIKLFLDRRDRLRDDQRKVIDALFDAVDATKKYANRTAPPVGTGDAARNPDTEQELSRLWMRASDAMYRMNPDLAHRCEVKSEYWEEPTRWDKISVYAANISLDTIHKVASTLRRQQY